MADVYEAASEDVVEQAKANKGNIFARTVLFFNQVIGELKKVTRPTYRELVNYTGVVLAFVTIVMVVISLLDWLFSVVVNFTFGA